jgi:hypothetical protein
MARAAAWVLAAMAACGGKAIIDGSGGGGGGGGGAGGSGDASSTSLSVVAPASATGGGSGNCAIMPTGCNECAAMVCPSELQACLAQTACDAAGNPIAGCFALFECAAMSCPGGDIGCVSMFCSKELESCAGSDCIPATQQLGDCVEQSCSMSCFPP